METIKIDGVTIGNLKYSCLLDVEDDVLQEIKYQGALRVLQGAPSGAWEKSMAYPGDGVKRPEKFKRTDIPFSDEAALALEEFYSKAQVEVGRDEKDNPIKKPLGKFRDFVAVEYTGAAAPEPKYAAAKALLRAYLFLADGVTSIKLGPTHPQAGAPRSAATFAESRGLAAPTEPWDEDTEFLKAVTEWQKAENAKKD